MKARLLMHDSDGFAERKGIEWVSDDDRRGRPRDLLWPWAAPNINLICVTFGMYVVTLGLGWVKASLAALFGAVASFFLVGLVALAGQSGGAPTMIASRAAFGLGGNKAPCLLSYLSLVGWEVVGAVLSAFAARTVALRLDPHMNPTPVMVAAFAVVIVCTTVVGMYGLRAIFLVQRFLAIGFAVLTTVYFCMAVPHASLTSTGRSSWGDFGAGVAFVVTALGLGWVNCAADYSRYLPGTARKSTIAAWTTLGAGVPPILLMTFGIVLAGGDPAVAAAATTDPVGALTAHLPTWFLIPYLAFSTLGFVSASIMNLYSSSLALLSMGVRLPRNRAVIIDAALVAVAGGYVAFKAPNFFSSFQAFLTVIGVPMAAWTGIFLVDLWQRRHIGYTHTALYDNTREYGRINHAGVWTLVTATTVGLGLVTSSDPHINALLGYFFTHTAKQGELGHSNIGVFAALAIAIPLYHLLHRPHPQENIERAASLLLTADGSMDISAIGIEATGWHGRQSHVEDL